MRTAITLVAILMLATAAFALLGIWLRDGRWGWTAGVSFVFTALTAAVVAWLLDESERRR